mmetsp:Transcript_24366/g.48481  ORF Transcript_24366/g.48481 Transcript_24366/m.48481 type:complete len:355 (-) Transcript_24366:12-1076(-)
MRVTELFVFMTLIRLSSGLRPSLRRHHRLPPSSPFSLFSSQASLPPLPPLPSLDAHPLVGFGTYKVGYIPPSAASAKSGLVEETKDARTVVKAALDAGYRFLDCAEFYGNEDGVGDGIRDWGGERSQLFLASKVWTTTIEKGANSVRSQVLRSLEELGAGYLDLCCVHWPVPGCHVAAFEELVRCKEEGLVRDVGLSNYAVEDYEEIPRDLRRHVAVNQIEVNPFLYRKDTIEFFQSRGVIVQSYRSLRDGKEFSNPALVKIAEKHGRSTAQVMGRWCLQKGCVYIPKTTSEGRMRENMDVLSFELDGDDMEVLDGLTTEEARTKMRDSYKIGVVRDTTLEGKEGVGVKENITM